MTSFVLALSGRIASGKSTLALHLSDMLNCPRASFGDFVRIAANSRGLEPTGDNLQAVGADLIESGWEPFCRAVLTQSGWQPGQILVVDGIRHIEALNHIRMLVYPSKVFHFFIRVEDALRTDRIRNRKVGGPLDERDESHPTEYEVMTSLPLAADLIVNGAREVEEMANQIIEFTSRPEI